MNHALVIYLPKGKPDEPVWSYGRETHVGDIKAMLKASEKRQVKVLVPGEEVVLLEVTLPKMSRARLRQAVPFALEEQLISDVDSLHFALSPEPVNGRLFVAVTAKDNMQAWLQQLATFGVTPDVLLPATLALPLDEGHWSVWLDDVAVVRTGEYSGFACDAANVVDMLQLALTEASHKPSEINMQNYTTHAYAGMLSAQVMVQEDCLSAETKFANLLSGVTNRPTINLLQASYVPKKSSFPSLQVKWRLAVYLGVAWVALLFLGPVVSNVMLSYHERQLTKQIQAIYKHHFPQATSVVAPKERMQDKLNAVMSEASDNHLLLMLGYVGQAMSETRSIKLKRLDYHDSQLTLELSAATAEDFSQFSDHLVQQGLTVKQQNADLAGSRINATLMIR